MQLFAKLTLLSVPLSLLAAISNFSLVLHFLYLMLLAGYPYQLSL